MKGIAVLLLLAGLLAAASGESGARVGPACLASERQRKFWLSPCIYFTYCVLPISLSPPSTSRWLRVRQPNAGLGTGVMMAIVRHFLPIAVTMWRTVMTEVTKTVVVVSVLRGHEIQLK